MATVSISETNFEQFISKTGIVLIDFWAPWCGPCRSFGPIFEKASDRHPDMVFGKVNTEEEQRLAAALRIHSIPTLMIFRDGILIFSQPGMLPANVLEEVIGKVASLDMEEVLREVQTSKSKSDRSKPAPAAAS